jgi:hypothetical protein
MTALARGSGFRGEPRYEVPAGSISAGFLSMEELSEDRRNPHIENGEAEAEKLLGLVPKSAGTGISLFRVPGRYALSATAYAL